MLHTPKLEDRLSSTFSGIIYIYLLSLGKWNLPKLGVMKWKLAKMSQKLSSSTQAQWFHGRRNENIFMGKGKIHGEEWRFWDLRKQKVATWSCTKPSSQRLEWTQRDILSHLWSPFSSSIKSRGSIFPGAFSLWDHPRLLLSLQISSSLSFSSHRSRYPSLSFCLLPLTTGAKFFWLEK